MSPFSNYLGILKQLKRLSPALANSSVASFAFQNIIHILFRISCDKLPNNDFIIISYHDIIGKEPVKDYYITFKSKCIKSKKYEPLDKQLVNPNLINIIDKIMNKSKKLESIDFCIILLDDKSNILYKLVKYY